MTARTMTRPIGPRSIEQAIHAAPLLPKAPARRQRNDMPITRKRPIANSKRLSVNRQLDMLKLAAIWGHAIYSGKSTRTTRVEVAYQRNKNVVCVIAVSEGERCQRQLPARITRSDTVIPSEMSRFESVEASHEENGWLCDGRALAW